VPGCSPVTGIEEGGGREGPSRRWVVLFPDGLFCIFASKMHKTQKNPEPRPVFPGLIRLVLSKTLRKPSVFWERPSKNLRTPCRRSRTDGGAWKRVLVILT